MNLKKLSIVFLGIVFFCISCKKETSWDIDAAIPIANSHLDLNNFFEDTIFKADPSGLLHLKYQKDILSYNMDSLIKLPDTTLSFSYILPPSASLGVNPGDIIYSNSDDIDMSISNGVEIVKAIVKKGVMKADFVNTATQPINFVYKILSANLWGNTFVIDEVIPAGSPSHPTKVTKYYQLDNYEIKMVGASGNKVNSISQQYIIKVASNAQPADLGGGEGIVANISYTDIIPEYVQGYFGQQDLSFGPDSSYLGFLKNLSVSNLTLQQANINFNIINEFGVDLSSEITSVKSINSNSHQTVNLNSGGLLSSINVNRAGKTNNPSNPVFPYYKQISLTSGNSNLLPFIENLPDYLGYGLKAKLNPLGNVSGSNDFAYYGHGLKVVADVDIPLILAADYFTLISYAKLDLTKLDQIKDFNSCEMILQATNHYALNAIIQGYMIDENNQIIDSLYQPGENEIKSGIVNVSNQVIQSTYSRLVSVINNSGMEHLKKCKQMKIVTRFQLPNQPTPIQVEDSDYLDLILNVNVNYRAHTN